MSIYSDDFQSYAVGASSPFGSLTQGIYFAASTITNDPSGIFSKTKCVGMGNNSGLRFVNTGIFVPAISTFFGTYFTSWESTILRVYASATQGNQIGRVETNFDGTISLFFGSTRIATSTDSLSLYKWNWFQVNFSYADVGGFLQLTAEIAVDQKIIISTVYLSTTTTASLPGVGVETWEFTNRYFLAEVTLDVLQAIGTDPNPGSPSAHITQGLIELHEVPDSANVRVTQGLIEVHELPDSANLRITQGLIEIYIALARSQGWQIYEA